MPTKLQLASPCLVALWSSIAIGSAPPVCFDFDGSMPPGAILTRATARTDATGALIAPDTARFTDDLIAPAVQHITSAPYNERVADVQVVGGVEYTAIIENLTSIRIVTETPLCDYPRAGMVPDPTVLARFGYADAEWGVPKTVEIMRTGVVLVHCALAGVEHRTITLRTTLATFSDPDGWALVRVSDYVAPAGHEPAFPLLFFTRTTYLPHLGVSVSTIADYTSLGLVSSVDPNDGRALGYASTDGGLSWTRVIDTDDPDLGRPLVELAKHLHHLEPFEWYDTGAGQWKIGAVGCLGDTEGRAGQIWVRSPSASFPPEGQNNLLTVERTRTVGHRGLTDIFPLDNSQGPGEALRFIQGNDTELSGIVEARVKDGVEEDIAHFRPTIPCEKTGPGGLSRELPDYPYIFQMDRIGNGSIIAGTTEASSAGNPNGFWQSDITGTRWATARLDDVRGFTGVTPQGANRFWTLANLNLSRPYETVSQLWQAGTAIPRTPVMLGAASHDGAELPLFHDLAPPASLTDATGAIAGPEELPASTPIDRLVVTSAAYNSVFSTASMPITGAVPGDFLHMVFWLRPAPVMAGCQSFQLEFDLTTTLGATVATPRLIVDHETNMWTRVAVIAVVPPDGLSSITVRARVASADATPEKPIDFYLTHPTVFLAHQPVRQHAPVGAVSEDRLTVPIPGLGSEWTIAIRATEAMTFAASLVDGNGQALWVAPGAASGDDLSIGFDTTLEVRSGPFGSSVKHGETSKQDVFVPTQDLVFFRHPGGSNQIEVWSSRGMGPMETVIASGVSVTPTEVRFGTPEWSTIFEGNVHRVTVWPDRALTETEMLRERLTVSNTCVDAPAIDVSEPIYPCPPPPPTPCVADLTGDQRVDAADFNVLASNFGGGPGLSRSQGDLTGDGFVNAPDFNVLAGDFGCDENP